MHRDYVLGGVRICKEDRNSVQRLMNRKPSIMCPFYNLFHGLVYRATCGKSMQLRYKKKGRTDINRKTKKKLVLTVIQLLMINLAMDTLAAIAFGSEPPLKEYIKEKPLPRSAGIVSKAMLAEVLISAAYITFICLSILFFAPVRNLFGAHDITYLKSALFATFMMAITFNGIKCSAEATSSAA